MNKSDGIIVNSYFIKSVVLNNANVPEKKLKVVEIPLNKKFVKLTSDNFCSIGRNQMDKKLVFLSVTNFHIPRKLQGLIFFLPLIKRIFSELATNGLWIIAGAIMD